MTIHGRSLNLRRIAAGVLAAGLLAGCGSTAAPTGSSSGSSPAPSSSQSSPASSPASSSSAPSSSSSPASSGKLHILETGSTLLYPLFNIWVPVYTKANPNVQITTQGTGSGTGIAESIKGVAQIGASDAYLAPAQAKQNPTMMNIPLAISAQQVNYNIPGLNSKHLKLSGPVLAGIYMNKIQYWDNSQIAALNPGVKLPHKQIIPIHRTDGSGDTFIFSQYLSFSTPAWNSGPHYGTSISWPANPRGVGAEGNPGMVQACKQAPYSVAYIGVSWLNQTNAAHLGEALLENKAGNFVLPTTATVKAAASGLVAKTPPNETISLIFASGKDAYPIINYEYAMVNAKQANPAVGQAVKKFLTWAVSPTEGNSLQYLNKVHFVPLPSSVAKLSLAQINKIGA